MNHPSIQKLPPGLTKLATRLIHNLNDLQETRVSQLCQLRGLEMDQKDQLVRFPPKKRERKVERQPYILLE